ncbi:type VII secretion-associated serine protease mycosin [Streptomyces griseorubiginosus]|uniref:type VII secretion-associated serine protease mycosin n=1 Tax=Streptomyces griseorubiginosus TaxID=67304 RepID=UPI0033CD06C6
MGFKRTLRVLGSCVAVSGVLFASAPTAAADQVRDDQWALKALNAESVWKISQGSGVVVAVIDNGVNATHVDLKGNVLEGKDFVDGGSAEPSPGENHGTAMASIIAAHGHGVDDGVIGLAPKAKILPVRDSVKVKLSGTIRYAVDNGASVINVSSCFDSSDPQALQEVSDAVAYALSKDVLVVGAAGNEDDKGGKCYPAASPGALGVGAVKNDGLLWSGSNTGSFVALTAPGANIVSANADGDGYHAASGTSDAAAYTSAAVALLRSKYPDLTAGQIVNRLVKTAAMPDSEKGLSLPDKGYGYGIIQPLAALKENIPAGSKYGPLTVPESLKEKSATSSPGSSAAEQEKADNKAMLIWAVIGVVGLAVVGLIVFLVVKASKRNKNNSGGPGGPASHQHYGQQPAAPHQNPYQQPAPPQQNPYQQPSPPHSQWPPQQ